MVIIFAMLAKQFLQQLFAITTFMHLMQHRKLCNDIARLDILICSGKNEMNTKFFFLQGIPNFGLE